MKIIKKIIAQLKKDKISFTIAEIWSEAKQPVGCKEINVPRSRYSRIRKSKICDACSYQGPNRHHKGRRESDRFTMISLKGEYKK